MVDISRKTYEKNGVETIIHNDGILWLNEKYIEEGLDHKNLGEITININRRTSRRTKKTTQQNFYRTKN